MKKIISVLSISAFVFASVSAFDWPEEDQVQSDSFSAYFAQLRGETMTSSLVFRNKSKVKAAESGKTICVLSDTDDDDDFFPSTLGNAVIIAHKDNILTVYGNLSSEISSTVMTCQEIEEGSEFSESADSAWQENSNGLEFQIIDAGSKTAINPRMLMPRIGKELPLYLGSITLKNRNGRTYKIPEQNVLPQGVYRIYSKRQTSAVPYKTSLSVNGIEADSVSYDILKQDDGLLCAQGKRNYPKSVVYPDKENLFLGEVSFTPGKNALLLSVQDILGKEVHLSCYITNY